MVKFHFPHQLINLIKSSIMETYVKVRVGAIKSEQIPVKVGLGQGDSYPLYYLILHWIKL